MPAQQKVSRRDVTMVWIESVRSLAYQSAKIVARTAANAAVLARRLSFKPSVRASVICVPTMLKTTALDQ
jgi:hypothetical protein